MSAICLKGQGHGAAWLSGYSAGLVIVRINANLSPMRTILDKALLSGAMNCIHIA